MQRPPQAPTIDSLTKSLNAANETVAKLEKRIKELEEKVKKHNLSDKGRLQRELDDVRRQYKDLNDRVSNSIEDYNGRIFEPSPEEKALRDRVESLERQLAAATSHNEQLRFSPKPPVSVKAKDDQAQLLQTQANLKHANAELIKLTEKSAIDQRLAQAAIAEHKRTIAALTADLEKVRGEGNFVKTMELTATVTTLMTQLERAQSDLKKSLDEATELKKALATSTTKLNEVEVEHANALKNVQSDLKKSLAEVAELKNALAASTSKLTEVGNDHANDLKKSLAEVAELKNALAVSTSKLTEAEVQLLEVRAKEGRIAESAVVELQAAKEEIAALKAKLTQTERELAEVKVQGVNKVDPSEEVVAASKAVVEMRFTLSNLTERLAQVEKELVDSKASDNLHVEELAAVTAERDSLRNTLAEVQARFDDLEAQVENRFYMLEVAKSADKKTIARDNEVIKALDDEVKTSRSKIANQERELASLAAELAAARALVPASNSQAVAVAPKDTILGPATAALAGFSVPAVTVGILILLMGLGIDLAPLVTSKTAGVAAGGAVTGVFAIVGVISAVLAIRAIIRNSRVASQDLEAQNQPNPEVANAAELVPVSTQAKVKQTLEAQAVAADKGKAPVDEPMHAPVPVKPAAATSDTLVIRVAEEALRHENTDVTITRVKVSRSRNSDKAGDSPTPETPRP